MAKEDVNLGSRTGRKDLTPGNKYMVTLAKGCYLGYRRPTTGAAGVWMGRWYDPATQKILQVGLGEADDLTKADGTTILDRDQAKIKAEAWFKQCARKANREADGDPSPEGGWTVADAINFYIEDARKSRKHPETAEEDLRSAQANIIPELGPVLIAKLTHARIKKWHEDLAARGRIKTGRKREAGEPVELMAAPATDDARKKRKASANRSLAMLRAALNFCMEERKLDPDHVPWARVKLFRGVKGRRLRFLNVAEQQALVEACDPDFAILVQGALHTGARYGELIKAKVEHLDMENGALWVDGKGRDSRTRWIFLTKEGEAFFEDLAADKKPGDSLFTRSGVARKGGGGTAVEVSGQTISLSPDEATLMKFLVGHHGHPLRYDRIRDGLWPSMTNGRRKVTNTLLQLRRKLKVASVTFIGGKVEMQFIIGDPEAFRMLETEAAAITEDPDTWWKDDAKFPMKAAYERAGIPKLTFHELRHTYASGLINKGVSMKVVAEQLGHADTRMVEEHYGHLAEKAKRDTIRTQSPILNLGKKKPRA